MSIGLNHVMTVVPLHKPREKLWAKRTTFERGRASQITDVLAKFEEVDDRGKIDSLPGQGNVKGELENRPSISSWKGFAKESPGL